MCKKVMMRVMKKLKNLCLIIRMFKIYGMKKGMMMKRKLMKNSMMRMIIYMNVEFAVVILILITASFIILSLKEKVLMIATFVEGNASFATDLNVFLVEVI